MDLIQPTFNVNHKQEYCSELIVVNQTLKMVMKSEFLTPRKIRERKNLVFFLLKVMANNDKG